jgi:hypothetical protein
MPKLIGEELICGKKHARCDDHLHGRRGVLEEE